MLRRKRKVKVTRLTRYHLRTGDADNTLGLYVHIPFCVSKCAYCDFYSIDTADRPLAKYEKAMTRHITEVSTVCRERTVDTIYVGGGTPPLFGAQRLKNLLKTLKKRFSVDPDAEITIEANPATLNKKELIRLKKAGYNRLSIGVQSANDLELRAVNRSHDFAQAEETIIAARAAGFDNISVDLIYGLPFQSVSSFEATLEHIINLSPEHISCYGLKLSEEVPLAKSGVSLPDDDEQADMYESACRTLHDAGYEHYEISNFAKPGMRSRHNMRYWDMLEYFGFGPGAHSFLFGRRFSCKRDLGLYLTGDTSEGDASDETEALRESVRFGEYIMLRLRLSDGINPAEFSKRFHISFTPFIEKLDKYIKSGHAAIEYGRYRLTEKGFLISNHILCDILDAELAGAGAVYMD